MKGLLLAFGCSLLCALGVTLVFCTVEVRRHVAVMVRVFLATVPLYLVAYVLTPPDLGLLAPWLVEPHAALDWAFGLFVHAGLFFGGWLQLYNLADRGFSLHILIAIDEAPEHALSPPEIASRYGGRRGLRWMLRKRIDGILDTGLVALREGRFRATPKGARAAWLFGGLRAFLQIDTRQ